jgi:DNA-binding phage protein
MDLASQLRKAMKDSGMALYAIAKGAGLDYPVVYRFYHEKRDIRVSSVSRLADFLGLELTTAKAKKARLKKGE